ncbi:MAG TPA: S41 family peptidase, partial [Thermoanaerobaculia bacterium]|nr:S41 family peptidase [Thermoanaerobaculia bacterium]
AWRARARRGNWGLPRAEVLPGNVGLLEVRRFQPPDLSVETIAAAMGFLANVDALVVDVRGCRGGSARVMPYFAGYFFASPKSLFDMEFRGDNVTERFWTLPWLPGRRLADVPMYVLTSAYTFSGAEGFAYRLQVLKRATIVGETTGGGANAGGVLDVPPFFRVYMPMGRPVDQTTRTNWDGTGVVPDVRTTAPEALYVAPAEALKLLRPRAAGDAERARLDFALERAEGRHHPPRFAPGDLDRLAGDYGSVRVRLEGGQLRLEREAGKPYLLLPLTATVFSADIEDPVRAEFLPGPAGRIEKLAFTDEDGKREELPRGASH